METPCEQFDRIMAQGIPKAPEDAEFTIEHLLNCSRHAAKHVTGADETFAKELHKISPKIITDYGTAMLKIFDTVEKVGQQLGIVVNPTPDSYEERFRETEATLGKIKTAK